MGEKEEVEAIDFLEVFYLTALVLTLICDTILYLLGLYTYMCTHTETRAFSLSK